MYKIRMYEIRMYEISEGDFWIRSSMMMKWKRLIGCSNIRKHSSRRLSSFAGIPTDESRVTAVLGGQWGDEGKGTFY